MNPTPSSFLKWQWLGVTVVCLIFTPLLSPFPTSFLAPLNAKLTDTKFKILGPTPPSDDIAIIAIDDKILSGLEKQKLPRDVMALLIDQTFKMGAQNIGFDILFAYPSEGENPKADLILARTLKKYKDHITLGWFLDNYSNPVRPLPVFTEFVKSEGFLNAQKDLDGSVRTAKYLLKVGNTTEPSMPLATIAQRLGQTPVSLVTDSKSPIWFLGAQDTIPTFSAADILKGTEITIDAKRVSLRGKTIFIGGTAAAEVDQLPTPFDRVMPGVEIQASIADQILRHQIPKESSTTVWLLTLTLSLFLVWGFQSVRMAHFPFLLFGSLIIFIGCDLLAFSQHMFCSTALLYLTTLGSALLNFSYRFYLNNRQKNFLRNAFSKYLAPDVVKMLISKPEALSLGGEKREISTLFCDLRNFTTISEKMEPAQLNQLLNEVFTLLTGIIFKHQGTVDKYIGDALMAFFGAPLEQPDHAFRACEAAKEMVRETAKRKADLKATYGVDIDLGIGINTGVAHVGNMGSAQRFNYSVLGDSVNIASRVEACTKDYHVCILTTQATLDSIAECQRSVPNHRSIAKVVLKGKSVPLELFEVIA
jgi:adenylate cyclase